MSKQIPANSFEEDFLQWRVKAGELLEKFPSDDNKSLVAQQAEKFAKILKKANKKEKKRLEKEIRQEEKEIKDLEERLRQGNTFPDGSISGLLPVGDQRQLLQAYRNIYEVEWQAAFQNLMAKKSNTKKSVESLLVILQECYRASVAETEQTTGSMKAITLHGEDSKQIKKMPDEPDLTRAARQCQISTVQYSISNIKERIRQVVQKSKQYPKDLKENQVIHAYTSRCIEICWLMALEYPNLALVDNPQKQCKSISSYFPHHKSVGKKLYVAWPAVVNRGTGLLQDWELFDEKEHNKRQKELEEKERQDRKLKKEQDKSQYKQDQAKGLQYLDQQMTDGNGKSGETKEGKGTDPVPGSNRSASPDWNQY